MYSNKAKQKNHFIYLKMIINVCVFKSIQSYGNIWNLYQRCVYINTGKGWAYPSVLTFTFRDWVWAKYKIF